MATKIILIRHGETEWNRGKIFRGTYDIPLNDNGRNQAKLAAKALKKRQIDAAYTSPLSRAVETAQIVLGAHNIAATPHDAFIDIDYGQWTGLPDSEVAEKFPAEHSAWQSAPQTIRIPGGNTLQEVYDKACNAMEAITEKHKDQTVAIFSHRVVNKLLIIAALNLPLESFGFIIQGNCCINEFERIQSGYLIHQINNTTHITSAEAELLTDDF